MKFLLKWAFRLFVLLLALLAILALSFDTIVTSFAEGKLRKQTGLEVRMEKLELRPWSGRARVEKLVLYNPPEFGGGPLVNVAELRVEYDPALARERKLHLTSLRFDLAELNIVLDKDGQSNLDGVRRTVEKIRRGQRVAKTNAPIEFAGLDMMNLTLGKATWTDLRTSGTPREFNLGIRNEVVQDMKDSKEVVAKLTPILVRAGLAFFGVGQPVMEPAPTNRPPALQANEATVPKR
ncbi:MAG: hypothetical protein HZA92_15650 [Verrucomicrobia bacterium]|nr:hypothetical protein [Verrucomicrobiota bacterium]